MNIDKLQILCLEFIDVNFPASPIPGMNLGHIECGSVESISGVEYNDWVQVQQEAIRTSPSRAISRLSSIQRKHLRWIFDTDHLAFSDDDITNVIGVFMSLIVAVDTFANEFPGDPEWEEWSGTILYHANTQIINNQWNWTQLLCVQTILYYFYIKCSKDHEKDMNPYELPEIIYDHYCNYTKSLIDIIKWGL